MFSHTLLSETLNPILTAFLSVVAFVQHYVLIFPILNCLSIDFVKLSFPQINIFEIHLYFCVETRTNPI